MNGETRLIRIDGEAELPLCANSESGLSTSAGTVNRHKQNDRKRKQEKYMNKFLRKAMILALAGTMTMGMSGTAMAATQSGLNTSTTAADTSNINLLKDYVNGSSSQTNTKSPEETFTFTIERYGLWNVGENGNGEPMYTKGNMPTFNSGTTENPNNTFIITAPAGAAGTTATNKLSTALTVPTYEAVGDYWYKVTETDNNIAGVIYGTNDSQTENITLANGNHQSVYYMHVQVTNATTKDQYVRTVTLHKTAPDANTVTTNAAYEDWYKDNNTNSENQTKKVNDIQNKYYAGSLEIKKTVTGNAGDKNELFAVTVNFTNESGASMNSDITYTNYYNEKGDIKGKTSLGWTDTISKNADSSITHSAGTKSVTFYVKDGTTVTFDNIPYGVSYTITETQPGDDKYTHSFAYTESPDVARTFNGVTTAADTVTGEHNESENTTAWTNAKATGSISDDLDTVTITNDKQSTIDVGVITSNAPYVAMLVLAGVAVLLYVRRRKDMIEE